jgi:hypothetical protein
VTTEVLKFSPGLGAQAGACTIKTDWVDTVKAGLGANRRVRCYYDPAGGPDASVSGTEFLIVSASGEMQMTAGNITYLGKLSGVTKQTAVDLSTGSAVLRIEGNGEWAQGSLGLPGADTLFHMTANMAAGAGVAIKRGTMLKAPIMLDAGTGPLSVPLSAGMVHKFRLCDWSTGARVVVGTAEFSQREPNVVMEHPWQAQAYGDMRLMRVPDGQAIVWGTGGDAYIFAGDNLISNPVTNGEADAPLQSVEIRAKPYGGRWPSYPYRGGFNMATDTMAPPPHTIELLDENDNIIDVIEMYSKRDANNTPGSGWPVNDERLKQDWSSGDPVQCTWTCRQVHAWFSHQPKEHPLRAHFLPGVKPAAVDPMNVSGFATENDYWPVITDNYPQNGMGLYRVCPKWSRGQNTGLDTTIIDTYQKQINREGYITQAIGYGFEPAATGKHTVFMSPGGSRVDRGAYAHPYVMWATNPTGNRIHGSVPWRELVHHWTMNYFNHGSHYFTDVYLGKSIPKDRVLAGDICYDGAYYGSANFRPDMDNSAVHLLCYANAQHHTDTPALPYRDKNGRMFSNEFNRDLLHSIPTAAVATYLLTSPRHVLNARHSFTSHVLCTWDFTHGFNKDDFLIRAHAWHMWQFSNIWVDANNHVDGFTLDEIEEMWGRHLEQVYDAVMPEYLAQNTMYGVTLKRYGVHLKQQDLGNGTHTLVPNADLNSKVFYAGQAFMHMKQSGSYDKMRARSPKCQAVIDLYINCLNTFAIGVFLDAEGRPDRYDGWQTYPEFPFVSGQGMVSKPMTFAGGIANLPASWDGVYPAQGSDDWIHFSNGEMQIADNVVDGVNTKHYRAQWLYIMRDYFPELVIPRLDQAIAKVDGWYAQVEAARPDVYWGYRFAMMGEFFPPAQVGAPT